MKKRIGAALLAAGLSLSLVLPAAAVGSVSVSEAAEVVSALNIMVGDEHGNLNLDRDVKRSEFITMVVKASAMGDQVGEASTSPYPDVPRKHWAAGFVQTGVQMGLIAGYLDGTFRPDNKITLAEGATIVLKLLGYTSSDFSGAYPTAQMAMYRSMGLDEGVQARNSGDVLDRQDAMYLFYNMLSTRNKTGQYYLNTLGYSLNAAGEVDRVSLLGQVMEGPAVAEGDWTAQIPFDVEKAAVHRAGVPSDAASVQEGDLLYWNEGMRRLWVYTDRVTGTIQGITPSAANPTSVTVAGRTFAIETVSAAYDLSDLGGYRLGDTVTLLLGRSGGVAAVREPSVGERTKVGIVTGLTKGSYSTSNGSSYTADTVTIQATDGKTYSYQWSTQYIEEGDLVQVLVASDGTISLKQLPSAKISGKFSADGANLGGYELADNIEIMDTYENMGIRVYPDRLAGVGLSEEMVRYYALDPQGEIRYLILDDVTGDMHRYGMMTDIQDMSMGMNILVTYEMDLGGQSMVYTSQQKKFPVKTGGFVLKGALSAPDTIAQLQSAAADRVDGSAVMAGSVAYPVYDHTIVYEYRDNEYYLSNLDRVNNGEYTLTVWYDKAPGQGGCARVLVAREK